ncbi:hypothetical protein [Actinomadura atramentaria]|uniref:hypothetical protein n=1 Tax=Actinomadura atramentaria TaxID=1990 RepID=UPI0003A13842|nr:hypothetical protein [Actinomadura atramentaria]
MADKTTTSFPRMGDQAHRWNVAPRTPDRSITVPKKHGKGSFMEAATAKHRKSVHERHGASFAPQMTMHYSNAPEASANLRNTKLMPSAVGARDFYTRRAYGQGM